ncbi:MAG TPA: prephenate dehydrogenase [Actinomycetes bacterium]|nr:prephenate dehydrogenase [Actinomycetes bacterium]
MSPSVQIVGAGLLGTSVGLALSRSPWQRWIADADPSAQALAAELGAGTGGYASEQPDLVLLAVPPGAMRQVMEEVSRLFPQATVSDVASIKTEPLRHAESLGLSARYIGGHPMAGRERSGAQSAQADLFDARPWAICPTEHSEPSRVELVERLARDCGADPVRIDAQTHDSAVALVSHLPHIAACGVAGQLSAADEVAMTLAGQGLRDTVRVAGGDPALWTQILEGNAAALAPLVNRLADELTTLAHALRDRSSDEEAKPQVDKSIERFLARGKQGHSRIPGKHGSAPTEYTVIPVVIPDEPGALARLFTTVAKAGASVEDIALEHSPGHPVGIIELSVHPAQAEALVGALQADGWPHH